MAVIKNLTTGVSMECLNVDVIKVCKNDANYEVADSPKKQTRKKKAE